METLQKALASYQKGSFINVKTRKPAKVQSAYKGLGLIEECEYIGARLGINYTHMKSSQAKGIPVDGGKGLPWGEWENYPFTINHNGKRYLRIYQGKNSALRTKRYYLRGVEVTYNEISHMLQKRSSGEAPDQLTLTIGLDSVVSIGKHLLQ